MREVIIGRHADGMEETRNPQRIFVRKSPGKCPFGRPRRRWKDNIKTVLKDTCHERRR
jgi:hypothetical protein